MLSRRLLLRAAPVLVAAPAIVRVANIMAVKPLQFPDHMTATEVRFLQSKATRELDLAVGSQSLTLDKLLRVKEALIKHAETGPIGIIGRDGKIASWLQPEPISQEVLRYFEDAHAA